MLGYLSQRTSLEGRLRWVFGFMRQRASAWNMMARPLGFGYADSSMTKMETWHKQTSPCRPWIRR